MKKILPKIKDVRFAAISIVLLIAFGALVSLIPYTGSDWAWGSSEGAERLKNFFYGTDGCYLGNVIAMLLTRSKALKIIIQALSFTLLCAVPYLLVKSKNTFTIVLCAMLLVFAPTEMFTGFAAYTTGFSKLMPALLFNLFYIYTVRNLFGKEEPYYKKYVAYILFFGSFLSGLCCEYFAIYNVLFSLLMIIWCRVKFYDAKNVNIFAFLGSLLASAVMFSNVSYYTDNPDEFEAVAQSTGIKAYLYRIFDNAGLVSIKNIHENIVIITVISFLFIAYGIWYLRKNRNIKKSKAYVICACLAGLVISTAIIAFVFSKHIHGVEGMRREDINYYYFWMIVSSLPIIVFLAFSIILLIEEKRRREFMLFLLLCFVLFGVPMLFFKDFFAGALFAGRVYMIIICALLVEYMTKRIKPTPVARKTVFLASAIYCAVGFVILFGAYNSVNKLESERAYYRALQNQVGQQTIYIEVADEDRLYEPNPYDKVSTMYYKLFYGLDTGAKIDVLEEEEYETFKSEFDYAIEESGTVLKE